MISRRAVEQNPLWLQGDPAQVQFGRGTMGRAARWSGGSALKCAWRLIIDKGKPMAAAMMGGGSRRH